MGHPSFERLLRGIIDTEEQQHELDKQFSNRGAPVFDEEVQHERFLSGDHAVDVQLRRSNDGWQVAWKRGRNAARHGEQDIQQLTDKEVVTYRERLLSEGLTLSAEWTTTRRVYSFIDENELFEVNLQHLPGFARLVTIEYKGGRGDAVQVQEHLERIFAEIGIKPINDAEFQDKILTYKHG